MLIISIAMQPDKGIGFKGVMPWHLKDELQLFKANTMGHTIVMGQTTYDNLPGKLKGRHVVVCSFDPEYELNDEDTEVIHDLDGYLKEHENDEEVIFICGGASIYRQSYPFCRKAYISFVKGSYEVDTYFDVFDMNDWDIEKEEEHEDFIYRELIRKEETQ